MYDGAMMGTDPRAELETAVAKLPAELRDHVARVVTEARRLAQQHGVDEARAEIAALGHDLYRAHVEGKLLAKGEVAGLNVSSVERSHPILLHGPLGALDMASRFGIADEEVLAAVRHHTTACAGMSVLEKLIYVADKIEPEKARAVPAFVEARAVADQDLDGAMRLILDHQIARSLDRGWPLHPDTVAARNELL